MLYTRKGDGGTSKLFSSQSGERLSKSDLIFEVLGTLDELNSALGFAKALSAHLEATLETQSEKIPYEEILEKIQEVIFIIQAQVGGADKHVSGSAVADLEEIIAKVEAIIPPITSFKISGGGRVGAWLDFTRTIARRAERRVVALGELQKNTPADTLKFLNRLSSALYALARLANFRENFPEKSPRY